MAQHDVNRVFVPRNREPVEFRIVDGPSLDAMWDSLKQSDPQYRKPVTFTVRSRNDPEGSLIKGYRREMQIDKLEREDGSGKNWIFGAYTTSGSRVEGFYNIDRREGWLKQ